MAVISKFFANTKRLVEKGRCTSRVLGPWPGLSRSQQMVIFVCGPDRGHRAGISASPSPPKGMCTHSPDGGHLAVLPAVWY